MSLRIAYLINQYPTVSHSFIRREIAALEAEGMEVMRIALRGWDAELRNDADLEERARTRYVLRGGLPPMMWAVFARFLGAPLKFVRATALAFRMMGRQSERPWFYHLAYLAEACLLLRWLNAAGAAHLHAHFVTNPAEVAMLVRELGGPPYSFTCHNGNGRNLSYRGMTEKIGRSAFVVAICSFVRSQIFLQVGHAHWPKVEVVHCGLERGFYEAEAAPCATAPRVVCVGRLCEEKGQLLLVEAAGRLVSSGLHVEVVFAGDGPMRPQIEAAVRRLGLQAQVRILGWIDSARVREEMLAARALVLPSFSEGLPVVIMEAMALRRPVLSTYVGGIPELVRPGETGWLVAAGSVDDLADAMRACLEAAPEELRRMGDAARRRVLEAHRIDVEAAKLADLFRSSVRGNA